MTEAEIIAKILKLYGEGLSTARIAQVFQKEKEWVVWRLVEPFTLDNNLNPS